MIDEKLFSQFSSDNFSTVNLLKRQFAILLKIQNCPQHFLFVRGNNISFAKELNDYLFQKKLYYYAYVLFGNINVNLE